MQKRIGAILVKYCKPNAKCHVIVRSHKVLVLKECVEDHTLLLPPQI